MKFITLFISLFLFVNANFAQDKPIIEQSKRHSVSIGLKNLTGIPKLSYNYLLNTNASIGSSISYSPKKNFSNNLSGFKEFSFKLNYKHFLSNKKKHQGAYFGSVLSFYDKVFFKYDCDSRSFKEEGKWKSQDIYFGLMIGYKYVHKSNFFIEGNISLNERLFKLNPNSFYRLSSKTDFSISIGKKF